MKTRVTELFKIDLPIIQAGMVWTAGWRLASAAANAGVLGLIGSGSMKPDLLREHIQKCKNATTKPFGVNIPLLRGDAADLIDVALQEGIKIIFTSAGSPAAFTSMLRERGVTVVHVVASVRHARKAEDVGCNAVVAEGFEAGGHNGIDEVTTFALVPQVVDAIKIPVIAAGGIADGRGIIAALALGAEGAQLGTRFAATVESSAHENYKHAVVAAADGDTVLTLKKVTPVRMIKNPFARRAVEAESRGASHDELKELEGVKRERKGIFEGDAEEGEMEAGQSSGLVHDVPQVEELVLRLRKEMEETINHINCSATC